MGAAFAGVALSGHGSQKCGRLGSLKMNSSMKLVKDLQKVIDKSRSLKPARLRGRFIPSQSISLSTECIGSLKSGSMNALSPLFSSRVPQAAYFSYVLAASATLSLFILNQGLAGGPSGSFPLKAMGRHAQY